MKTVSERLGHTNAAMTLNIYTHLWPDSEELTIYTHLWPDSEERTRAAVDQAYADQSADAQLQVDKAALPLPRALTEASTLRTLCGPQRPPQPTPSQVRRPFAERIRR